MVFLYLFFRLIELNKEMFYVITTFLPTWMLCDILKLQNIIHSVVNHRMLQFDARKIFQLFVLFVLLLLFMFKMKQTAQGNLYIFLLYLKFCTHF